MKTIVANPTLTDHAETFFADPINLYATVTLVVVVVVAKILKLV